jgi:predicted O-methyltransferase YrrM
MSVTLPQDRRARMTETEMSMHAAADRAGFESAWAIAEQIPGWLTRAQAAMLWQAARRLERGAHIVEIGSHQGRSTVVLARAAQAAGARVTAIDPFVTGRLFGGPTTRDRFEENLTRAAVTDTVTLLPEYSTKARPHWSGGAVDLLYIDGKHDYWTFTDDLRWSGYMAGGGEVLVHDCYSSIGVTSGVVVKILPSRRYSYVDRSGSLARFRLARPVLRDRVRLLRQLPWFLRNVALKILLRLRLRPVARLFGHDSPYDPY